MIQYIFGDTNYSKTIQTNILGGGGEFLKYCLQNEGILLDDNIITSIKYIFGKIEVLKSIEFDSSININGITSCIEETNEKPEYCIKFLNKEFDISFDCRFLKYDLNQLYRAISDASVESRILAALSLCISFFGAVALYFFLLVMHHYNNELFFDSGKSIFTGLDGFGGGYKKKIHDKDPAYKKRKLRAEIELTSKNDEQSAYKNINKNEDEE